MSNTRSLQIAEDYLETERIHYKNIRSEINRINKEILLTTEIIKYYDNQLTRLDKKTCFGCFSKIKSINIERDSHNRSILEHEELLNSLKIREKDAENNLVKLEDLYKKLKDKNEIINDTNITDIINKNIIIFSNN